MFVHTAAHKQPKARSRSKPRRETPSSNLTTSTATSSSSVTTLAAPFVPRGPSSSLSFSGAAKDSDPHGQGAVLPPVPLKLEYNKNSQLLPSTRRRRSSSATNADGAVTSPSDSKPNSEKKGHARRSSWQRRLSIGGSATLSATSLDRLDGVHRRPSVSSPKSPRMRDSPNPDPEKPVTADTIPVLPRTVYDIATTSTTAAPNGPAISTPWTQPSPADHFAPRTTSLLTTQGQERPRQASASRSPRKEELAEAKDRPRRLQKRNASQDTTASKASQDTLREGERDHTDKRRQKERREKDKKSMLSRALQNAHTAVLLDNAQNYEGAIHAYADACELLRQVLLRSSGEDDRRKLDAIRHTYEQRILELQQLSPNSQINGNRKSLPERPMSDSLSDQSPQPTFDAADDGDDGDEDDDEEDDEDEEPVVIETATVTRIMPDKHLEPKPEPQSEQQPSQPPILLTASSESVKAPTESAPNDGLLLRLRSDQVSPLMEERFLTLDSPMDVSYIPPPLSPRRLPSDEPRQPSTPKDSSFNQTQFSQTPAEPQQQGSSGHQSISWLDTIDESARNSTSSATSSVHSLVENGYFMRKHLRELSSATEAEFDAALDAAVEAAYDDGLEPLEFSGAQMAKMSEDPVATALANVQLAKNRVKEVEREEAILLAHRRHLALRTQKEPDKTQVIGINGMTGDFSDEGLDDAEEEERMLDEMTKEYLIDGFDFGLGVPDNESKSIPPQPLRQSDSSTYSGRTWNTSTSSSRTTGGSSLSAVLEGTEATLPAGKVSNGLPPLDEEARPSTASETSSMTARVLSSSGQRDSLRLRRLSGQNAKQLKIETSIPPATQQPATAGPRLQDVMLKVDPPARSAISMKTDLQILPDSVFKPPGSTLRQPAPLSYFPQSGSSMPSVSPGGESVRTGSPATPAQVHMPTGTEGIAVSGSPTASKVPHRPQVRKKSSLSLKQRQLSISSHDSPDNTSIGTPLSTTFSNHSRKALPPQPPFQPSTPGVPFTSTQPLPPTTGSDANLNLPSGGGISLFESADLHSPYIPGSPNTLALNAPIPLESCPGPYLLRPFWLMRCVYQTIAHPRGGYLSTRLFVPRDVWRVKGVKIKSVEEKIGNCDLLTAALGRLAAVDTLDADAVLEEMQNLETVFDQVQANLTKKLGSEVGVQGVNSLFKDVGGSAIAEGGMGGVENGLGGSKTASGTTIGGKSYLSGWRKLRGKGSSVNLPATTGTFAGAGSLKDKGEAAGWTMASVPMTNLPNIRFAKRDIRSLEQELEGPNRAYMGAVARLCDAVQIIDQIARQVEDPGLKHSSPTHVGLELCTRHASEFFGFYICRFVLSDLGMLMDKFIKRGSEWVLI